MNILAPSMLSIDFGNIERDLNEVYNAGANTIHVDIMDGAFVPNISFGPPVLKYVRKILPDAFLDVHMMVQEPSRYFKHMAEAGADNITFHYEATTDVDRDISLIREMGLRVGMSIKPATPVSVLAPYIDKLDQILIMSVEPGFGGQSFMPEAFDRLREARRMAEPYGVDVEVDGGIYLDNVRDILDAGANMIVTGSAVFKGNITDNVKSFLSILNEKM
ncbi:MAG: ribulose-phosphate 3-epimerase [Eubacterium sp.]|nr:ribulose-phosphate 3-epimerase [Eubacterium sp.]